MFRPFAYVTPVASLLARLWTPAPQPPRPRAAQRGRANNLGALVHEPRDRHGNMLRDGDANADEVGDGEGGDVHPSVAALMDSAAAWDITDSEDEASTSVVVPSGNRPLGIPSGCLDILVDGERPSGRVFQRPHAGLLTNDEHLHNNTDGICDFNIYI